MEKTKYLAIALVVMVILNVVMVFLYISPAGNERKQRSKHGGLSNLVVKTLELDEAQEQQYRNMRRMHKEEIGKLMSKKNEIKSALLNTRQDSIAEQLIDEIAALQVEMERKSRTHFLEVQSLCTPEQRPRYDTLTKRMGQWLTRNRGENKKEKK